MLLPEIYLVRHGVTIANEQGVFAGTMETRLSPEGVSQARAACHFLRQIEFARAYSSPMLRTRQTVAALDLDLEFEYDSRLKAMNFGNLQGQPFALGREQGLILPALFGDINLRFPGGECYGDVEKRVGAFMKEKLLNLPGPVLIVTHGAAGMILLATLLPQLKNQIAGLAQGNGDVICVRSGGFSIAFVPERHSAGLDSPFGR
jgi:broad specificity phosphatase PhoE